MLLVFLLLSCLCCIESTGKEFFYMLIFILLSAPRQHNAHFFLSFLPPLSDITNTLSKLYPILSHTRPTQIQSGQSSAPAVPAEPTRRQTSVLGIDRPSTTGDHDREQLTAARWQRLGGDRDLHNSKQALVSRSDERSRKCHLVSALAR